MGVKQYLIEHRYVFKAIYLCYTVCITVRFLAFGFSKFKV